MKTEEKQKKTHNPLMNSSCRHSKTNDTLDESPKGIF